ncbi:MULTISPECIES: glycosyltransferase [Methanohalophilus]|nr:MULTISPECIES: glycosyltransferase [Methanohalophilus]
MNIIIGSLQYSPIYKSHCCALGKQSEKRGHSVTYLFSEEYKWMLPEEIKKKAVFVGNSKNIISTIIDGLNIKHKQKLNKIFLKEKPDFVYMHNFHPFLNYKVAKLSQKYKVTFIQHVHEPYVENKQAYEGFKPYWLYLFEYAQEKALEKTNIAVMSSVKAMQLFKKRYPKFLGEKKYIPLIYEDLGNDSNSIGNRKYITFIGPPVAAKGPEIFLKIAEYSRQHNLKLNFILISRLQITDSRYYKWKNLKVYHKEKISDEEIANYLRQSIMTITPYKIATQSSVVLTSYMYGTPVLSSNIEGLSETVSHLKTGYLVDNNSDIKEWIKGALFIKDNLDMMSKNCRIYFNNEFSEINWPKYFKELLG